MNSGSVSLCGGSELEDIGAKQNVVCGYKLDGDHRSPPGFGASDYHIGHHAAVSLNFRDRQEELDRELSEARVERDGYALHQTPSGVVGAQAKNTIFGGSQMLYAAVNFSDLIDLTDEDTPPVTINSHRTVASMHFKSRFLMPGNNSPWDSHALPEHVRSGKAQLNMP